MLRITLLLALTAAACSSRPRFVVVGDAADGTSARTDAATGGSGGQTGSGDGSADSTLDSFLTMPDAVVSSCMPAGERMHALMDSSQVSSTDGVSYTSNPPSSGPNCGVPGGYGAYSEAQPLSRCYWINNLARGAIVLLYNCPGGCPDMLQQLAGSMLTVRDPDCTNTKRVLLTPDPQLPTKVAAVAWGYTWTSGCLDAATTPRLVEFMNAHIGSQGVAPDRHLSSCQ